MTVEGQVVFRLLTFLALLLVPAMAQARTNAIQPELIAEGPAVPGGEVELAILMHTQPGWHGYWQNPGDAGLPMEVQWQLPSGVSMGPLRYPVPTRLTVAGLMNYVYERDYAVLTRLKVPPGTTGQVPIRAKARWLACTDKICVPEHGEFALNVPTGGLAAMDTRFNEWRRALPRPLLTRGAFETRGDSLRVAIPLPASVSVREPYLFTITDDVVDYNAPQSFRRSGDTVVAELQLKGQAGQVFAGVLAYGDGQGLEFVAGPGTVPDGGTAIEALGGEAILWAVLGAIVGGILLNLMPCVFPILALKALHVSKAAEGPRAARADAIAYAAGAIIGTGALGGVLLAVRAAGEQVGWAFQLQDPRTIMLLLLLAVAITANLLGLFQLPVLGGRSQPAGSFGTGALAAFVATPCAGPFLGAALGTALLLPAAGSVLVFGALGLGLSMPFVALAFIPGLRKLLPKPGPWMARLQRFLAIPMGASAVAALWLLYRIGGQPALVLGLIAASILAALMIGYGYVQRRHLASGWLVLALSGAIVILSAWQVPRGSGPVGAIAGAERWDASKAPSYVARGHKVFVYFTADWCLTCKANEAAAIDREEVRDAFRDEQVKVLAADWTNGDPAITRFLDSRGRAGVPLYLWYEPGRPPEELPQILTTSMLTSRARRH